MLHSLLFGILLTAVGRNGKAVGTTKTQERPYAQKTSSRAHLVSRQEASQYLGQMLSPILSEEDVRLLILRTEGWAAGLQLAALQKRENRAAFLQAFTGSQRYLLDYVQEEILARLLVSGLISGFEDGKKKKSREARAYCK